MKIATFNFENLFTRPSAMNMATDAEGRQAIEDAAELNEIVRKEIYSDDDKARLVELITRYGFHWRNPPKRAVIFQKIRGRLFKKPRYRPLEITAKGRSSWTGWFELRKDDINWSATYNTGRVIAEQAPDVLIVVEVENRPTLERFNDQVLKTKFNSEYPHYMVIDGNDDRGIDVGIMSKFPIRQIRSHVDDVDPVTNYHLFSRDCAEFEVELASGETIIFLANHFKSKRSGNDVASQGKRSRQASKALEYARAALARSPYVVIAGDFNDVPDSDPIRPLTTSADFHDVMEHRDYPQDRPGTYNTGLASGKLDYLMLSNALWDKFDTCGIERRGSYHPRTWEAFDTVNSAKDEASDHHLVYAELDIV